MRHERFSTLFSKLLQRAFPRSCKIAGLEENDFCAFLHAFSGWLHIVPEISRTFGRRAIFFKRVIPWVGGIFSFHVPGVVAKFLWRILTGDRAGSRG